MDSIIGEVITTQSISGDVLPTQGINGNVNLPNFAGATTWQELTLKPFETLSTDFYVDGDGVLHVNGGGTSSNAVWYPTVSDDGDISWAKSDSEIAPTPKNIKGDKGDKGDTGEQGIQGIHGIQGEKGDTGSQGIQGLQGVKGDKGDTGEKGADGTNGIDGADGKSAYEVAALNGYVGTQSEWLLSLKGEQGIQGIQGIQGVQGVRGETGATGSAGTDGINGSNGTDGKSAYQSALDGGYTGTQTEWLASLNGNDGYSPTISVYESTDTSYVLTITNASGSYYTPNLKGSGGGTGSLSWGSITGDIASQTDLANALAGKAPTEHSHTVSDISDFPNSMPASDVSAWAKSPTKPTYTAGEVGALPDTTTIPTVTNDLTNELKSNYDTAYNHSLSAHAPANAEANVQANWSQADTAADDYIKNKPTIPEAYVLPTASTTVKGGIKVDGTSITVDENGVASASGTGGGVTDADVFSICPITATTLPNRTTTVVPWYMIKAHVPSSVISIGDYWVYSWTGIYEVNGGEHLTTVGGYFAYGCTSLTSISLPALTTAGSNFAQSCATLTSLSLPALTTAGAGFAYYCTTLTSLSLPALTTAGAGFALGCPLTHLAVGGANTLTLTSTTDNLYQAWKLPVADMVALGTALKTATSSTALIFGATYWNALSTAQKAIFMNKNYTVTTA